MKRTRMDTCLHEAAHAITAERLGWTVLGLRVNDDKSGACYFGPLPGDDEQQLRRDLTISLAGRVAEAMARGRDWRDLRLFRVLRVEGSGGKPCSYVDFVWRKAQLTMDRDPVAACRWVEAELPIAAAQAAFTLERHWNEVCDLAATLDRAATFDGVTVLLTKAGEVALEIAA